MLSIVSKDSRKRAKSSTTRFGRSSSTIIMFFEPTIRARCMQRIDEEDRKLLPWRPDKLDWYDYWLNIHLPGLKKWVFPKLEEGEKPKPRRIYTYSSLIELFDAATKNHAGRIAMRMERNGREESYTYGELRECALRAAAFLFGEGIRAEDRVGLISTNMPEWGMSYFGILRTGAACIPIEKDSTTADIVNLLRLGEAGGIMMSEELREEHSTLETRSPPPVSMSKCGPSRKFSRWGTNRSRRKESKRFLHRSRLLRPPPSSLPRGRREIPRA